MKKAEDELSTAAQKVGAKMYAETNKGGATTPRTDEEKKDEPIDAEFEEKKSE